MYHLHHSLDELRYIHVSSHRLPVALFPRLLASHRFLDLPVPSHILLSTIPFQLPLTPNGLH